MALKLGFKLSVHLSLLISLFIKQGMMLVKIRELVKDPGKVT